MAVAVRFDRKVVDLGERIAVRHGAEHVDLARFEHVEHLSELLVKTAFDRHVLVAPPRVLRDLFEVLVSVTRVRSVCEDFRKALLLREPHANDPLLP